MVAGLTALALVVGDQGRGGPAAWLQSLRSAWGVPLMLAIVLPWFVAIGVATHGVPPRQSGESGRQAARGRSSARRSYAGVHSCCCRICCPASLLRSAPCRKPGRHGGSRSLNSCSPGLSRLGRCWNWFPPTAALYAAALYPALCLLAARWTLNLRRDDRPTLVRSPGRDHARDRGRIVGLGAAALPVFIQRSWLDGSARPPHSRRPW